MQLEALYEQGTLKFLSPVTFTQTRFQVRVEVPPDVIASDDNNAPNANMQDLDDYARDLVSKLDAIRNAPVLEDDTRPQLNPKQDDRLEAVALRDDPRKGV